VRRGNVPGSLYLVPNLLGAVAPSRVLPAATIEVARALRHWRVETPKAARAFIKTLEPEVPIAALDVRPIAEAARPDDLLGPALDGADIGLLSDAGCPGVADPGAEVVAAAHTAGLRVVPLVGPSAILLALMAAGMNGQRFAFHGYLPAKSEARTAALQKVERESLALRQTQVFIETPYRNAALLDTALRVLKPSTLLCVAADLTLPSETIVRRDVERWRGYDVRSLDKRPALFVMQAV
jgi:16S rRNA (cytidine1402-2'-O)-methyltransferase